jgi:2-polyprenyl-3-methyl-5-hydroxy-6-metoxy-1,4-benzoquinol methylase
MILKKMSYESTFAAYYDLFYESKDYEGESAFLDKTIRTLLGRDPEYVSVLELACGTGTHSLLLAKQGYRIVATDNSDAMLNEAKRKATGSSGRITFAKMDMRAFHSFETPFDVVLCLFDSIGYLVSNDSILGTLKSIRKNMNPDGIFIMEFWNAGAMIQSHDPYREKTVRRGTKLIKRISETKLDYAEQSAEVNYSIYESEGEAGFQLVAKETHSNRFFLLQEMNFFLEQAGLKPLHLFSGFQKNTTPDLGSWHTVAISGTL